MALLRDRAKKRPEGDRYLLAGNLLTRETGRRWRWYHGLLFYLLVQGLTFALSGLVNRWQGRSIRSPGQLLGDVSYFEGLRQSIFAPPAWVFGPVWTLNNLSAIWGLLRVLNKPSTSKGRKAYLALQAASWLDYIIFSAAYFGLRSPLNALALTLLMLGLTIASGLVALLRLRDTLVALSLATLLLWLLLASTAALFQALWNRDALYEVGPFVEPAPGLLKRRPAK
ncbi:TspO/MBR family protein [Thermogemmatispora sp.]|uniref:TspO/MBR family protein n=1 Tax=Thermogemmatispora sp. TaxID=1968838 RepID=UPI001DB8AC70|nr:TspO/MBR family protein [Thermogemmatispora sp.]MBX5450863.1 tryptophan-rich sensory protein [Thermogemmatispora sp.]